MCFLVLRERERLFAVAAPPVLKRVFDLGADVLVWDDSYDDGLLGISFPLLSALRSLIYYLCFSERSPI
jgi:hypothetical protein